VALEQRSRDPNGSYLTVSEYCRAQQAQGTHAKMLRHIVEIFEYIYIYIYIWVPAETLGSACNEKLTMRKGVCANQSD